MNIWSVVLGLGTGLIGGVGGGVGLSHFWLERTKAKWNKELEALKDKLSAEQRRYQAQLDRSIFVSRAHFDTEFQAIKEVHQCLSGVKIPFSILNPLNAATVLTDAASADLMTRLQDANTKFLAKLEEWGVFLEPDIYDEFHRCYLGADHFLEIYPTEANQARDAAELAQRSNVDFYENQIAPALVQWDEEKQRLENEKARIAAEAAYYRTQNEQARVSGFIASDAPGYEPRDTSGRYVAGPTGSPVFQPEEVIKRAGDGLAMIADIDWKHRQLFDGKPLPISPSELVKQADARRLDPMTYASQTFGFQKREQELAEQRQKMHDDQIRKEATEQRDRFWAERVGSNPDVQHVAAKPQVHRDCSCGENRKQT